jgi:hypothetical protein
MVWHNATDKMCLCLVEGVQQMAKLLPIDEGNARLGHSPLLARHFWCCWHWRCEQLANEGMCRASGQQVQQALVNRVPVLLQPPVHIVVHFARIMGNYEMAG